jgi:NADP-dependent 3-hydroxy acid dehydrogenase YdfG
MDNHLMVVTGASSGVGYALAAELASRGHEVLAIARRQPLLEQLAASHANIESLVADVASAEGCLLKRNGNKLCKLM